MPATRTVSTYQGAGATTSLQILNLNQCAKILNIEGYCNAADSVTQYFLQIFAATSVPTNGTTPLRSLQVLGQDGFRFSHEDIGLTAKNLGTVPNASGVTAAPNSGNLLFVLSSTEATLTIATGGVTMDLSVDIEEFELQVDGMSTATSAVSTLLQVWSQATGAATQPRLYALVVVSSDGTDRYLQFSARDSAASHLLPIGGIKIPANTTVTINFGKGGLVPYEQTSAGVEYRGCSIGFSTAAPPYTRNSAGVLVHTGLINGLNIATTAYYK